MQIGFNKPPYTGNEQQYILDAMVSPKLSGDGSYGLRCQSWFEAYLGCAKALLTPSCTQALEIAALLINIQPGDEVIMPSYTFVSTANAFVLRGARIVFVDVSPDTMNINERLIEEAITPRTKAIVPVHYAGVACEMDEIIAIAQKHKLFVIEDAAQGMMSLYKGKQLGTFGHLGAYSFHETKNFTSGGEGGLLIINDKALVERAEIIREKGTNRSLFFRGMVDKYTWVDIGGSYLPSELQAAYLWGQLEEADLITSDRLKTWESYYNGLKELEAKELLSLPSIPAHCNHNGHIFYTKCQHLESRTRLLSFLDERGVTAVFHYVPLHSSQAGITYSRFHGEDRFTTSHSERLLRLPLWYGMNSDTSAKVIDSIIKFFDQ
jgi:dTDP-4-amino-4,6-dideoxygalactose transaminase